MDYTTSLVQIALMQSHRRRWISILYVCVCVHRSCAVFFKKKIKEPFIGNTSHMSLIWQSLSHCLIKTWRHTLATPKQRWFSLIIQHYLVFFQNGIYRVVHTRRWVFFFVHFGALFLLEQCVYDVWDTKDFKLLLG